MSFELFRKKSEPAPTLDVSRVLRSKAQTGPKTAAPDAAANDEQLNDAATVVQGDAPAAASKATILSFREDRADVEAAGQEGRAVDRDDEAIAPDAALAWKDPAPASDTIATEAAPAAARGDDGQQAATSPFHGPALTRVERLTPPVLWVSLTLVLLSVPIAIASGGVDLTVAAVFLSGVFLFGTLMLLALGTRAYSPLLLAGIIRRRPMTPKPRAALLAGGDILSALGLAEDILDADVDARLVTTRDGVVVYANDGYLALAQQAGVLTATGLPPRIDRLFGQAGSESSKMFRLARAARSGDRADEIITQTMGLPNAPERYGRRRFEVSVRAMNDKGQHVAWRLRELAVENPSDDLRQAFKSYPRAVVAVERSGTLNWLNDRAAELLGVKAGAHVAMSDFLLGEPSEVVDALWDDGAEEVEARLRSRDRNAPHTDLILTPFCHGGVGEGFVCVELSPKRGLATESANADTAQDLTDAPFGVAVIGGDPGTDAQISTLNRQFADSFGAKAGLRLSDTLSTDAIRDLVAALKSKPQNKPLTRAVDVTIGEGASAHNFKLYARPIKRRRGAYGPRQTVLYAIDVSFQKRMEEDYAHDKRLKAIGKISGSVAHDFNNFLQAILGANELLMRRHGVGDPSYQDLVSIRENAQRARNLTSNLLAFSRKQTLQSEVMSITDMLAEFTPFVQRYVTEKVKVEIQHGRNVPAVKADKSQLELAIMNLAVNARDAMDKGGVLKIETRRVPADQVATYDYVVLDEVDYALIELSDTGTGVPADIADKIFEPFFTTKSEGKGTGLGLSTVHGIIGQLGGRIFLHNRPGEGATFRIFLPAVSDDQKPEEKPVAASSAASRPIDDLTGKGRILVVEDEDSVRGIVVRALAMCGYEIEEACDGDEALEIIEDADEPFDVVLSDIMMPEMDGPTLVQEAGDKLKGARVIFMSGYAETTMRDKLDEIEGARYLQKPFTLKKVAATVKEAIEAA
jgi:two-component system cell cycle sensor histidine kinase/response regulator CckA